MTKHEAVKETDEITLKKVWREDVQVPAKFKEHRPVFLKVLGNFESM